MSEKQLILAIKEDNIEKVKELLALKLSIDERDEYGMTSLALAVGRRHPEIVKLLIKCGASINFEFTHSQLMMLIGDMNDDSYRQLGLMKSGITTRAENSTLMLYNALKIFKTSPGISLVTACIILDNLEIVDILLQSGAPIEPQFTRTYENLRGPKIRVLLEKYQNIRNFHNLKQKKPGYLSIIPTDIINVIGNTIKHMFDYDIDQNAYQSTLDISGYTSLSLPVILPPIPHPSTLPRRTNP